jgi:hypothetical protein
VKWYKNMYLNINNNLSKWSKESAEKIGMENQKSEIVTPITIRGKILF